MKKYFFIGFLTFFSFVVFSQTTLPHIHDAVSVNVDWQNQIITAVYNPNDDPCYLEYMQQVFDQEGYDNCIHDCLKLPPEDYDDCVESCDNQNFWTIETVSNIEYFEMQIYATTADGSDHPLNSNSRGRKQFTLFEFINRRDSHLGDFKETVQVDYSDIYHPGYEVWVGEEIDSHNTCITVFVSVSYSFGPCADLPNAIGTTYECRILK